MSLTVREVKAWLAQLQDDDAIGIDEDGMRLTLADARYDETWLEIGCALSRAHLATARAVCVRCGEPVYVAASGAYHTGHLDALRNQTCGWWGFRSSAHLEAGR